MPQVPAVYAMYGGRGLSRYAAYVGVAKNLRQRIVQHLVNRDSSVATGTTAVGLHADHVREVLPHDGHSSRAISQRIPFIVLEDEEWAVR